MTAFLLKQLLKGKKTCYFWDFFPENGNLNDISFCESGMGAYPKDLDIQEWCNGTPHKFWFAKGYCPKGKPVKGKILKYPKKITTWQGVSTNPFKVCNGVFSCYQCERCGTFSSEICDEHIYVDEKGDLRYKDDNSYAE